MRSQYTILIIWILFFSQCTNPFSVRDPEEPVISSDIYETPNTYDVVLSNLRYAIIQTNVSNYEKCFISNLEFQFRFLPDRRIEAGLFADWSVNSELEYIKKINTDINDNIIKRISVDDFDLTDSDFTQVATSWDSVQTKYFDYNITIVTPNDTLKYSGQSKMKLVKDANSLWYIYYWEDIANSDNNYNTWSYLKKFY